MYQVITLFEGLCYHEGFFDNERSANEHRDWLLERFYHSDLDAKVFVNSFDYE